MNVPHVAVRVVTRPSTPATQAPSSSSEQAFDLRPGDVLIIASAAVHPRFTHAELVELVEKKDAQANADAVLGVAMSRGTGPSAAVIVCGVAGDD